MTEDLYSFFLCIFRRIQPDSLSKDTRHIVCRLHSLSNRQAHREPLILLGFRCFIKGVNSRNYVLSLTSRNLTVSLTVGSWVLPWLWWCEIFVRNGRDKSWRCLGTPYLIGGMIDSALWSPLPSSSISHNKTLNAQETRSSLHLVVAFVLGWSSCNHHGL